MNAELQRKLKEAINENIARVGWHCTAVMGDETAPPFIYTVGLFETFGHPELIIIGLPDETAHGILYTAVNLIKQKALDLTIPSSDILVGYPVVFIPVDKEQYVEYATTALSYYKGENFPMFQLVWPTKDRLFPWSPKATQAFKNVQPILGSFPITH